jgi:hypothetical protein
VDLLDEVLEVLGVRGGVVVGVGEDLVLEG